MEIITCDSALLLRGDIYKMALQELFEYFKGRKWRYLYGDRYLYLCWNIKVYQDDLSGKSGPCPISPEYDILWESWVSKRKEFFWQCCEDGLQFIGDTKEEPHVLGWKWTDSIPELNGIDYILHQDGRSGGWLVLTSFDNSSTRQDAILTPDCIPDYFMDGEIWQKSEDFDFSLNVIAIYINFLKNLRLSCESLDKFNATEEWNYRCNFRRNEIEEDWIASDFSNFDGNELQEFLDNPDVPESVKEQIGAYIK